MSKIEDKEKEKTHPKKAEDNNFECHVSDIDLLFKSVSMREPGRQW